jgi:primosomal protein N' (replication factor Y) (superfamily II helicase)
VAQRADQAAARRADQAAPPRAGRAAARGEDQAAPPRAGQAAPPRAGQAAPPRAARTRRARGASASGARRGGPPAEQLPVARIAVDVPLAHLDRPFDYLVPQRLAASAVPGCRVRVRFAGQLTGGYLLERVAASEHRGRLAYLERVVSPEPVLSPEIAVLAREVADRCAGTLADVLRLAIPPRHAGAEAADGPPDGPQPGPKDGQPPGPPPQPESRQGPEPELRPGSGLGLQPDPRPELRRGAEPELRPGPGPEPQPGPGPRAASQAEPQPGPGPRTASQAEPQPGPRPDPGPWARYPAGPAFLAALAQGRAPRAVWSALPGPRWPDEIATAAAAAGSAGRGALIVVPDARDLGLIDRALARALGPGQHVCLSAGLGPAERYRRWLAVARGTVRVAAGTRAAMFAPVRDLGLVVIWDDGDDLHAEPRAPYPHAREVLALRAHRTGAGALIGGFARTAEAASLVNAGWAAAITAARPTVRGHAPQIQAAGADTELARDEAARSARMPSLALRTARAGLAHGPVLVQVPRRGYVTAVACENCRAPSRCARCGGPLALEAGGGPARCRWCGRADPGWRCPACGHPRVRALVTGAGRTAEELGRAFPGTPVVVSGGATVIAAVPAAPALVVATPGAEPRADGGYAAAVLLDGWVLLGRPSLRAAEEALRRWLNAAALVRPGRSGGAVAVVADAGLPVVQALIRWDPVTHAERELAEREALRFPPAVRMAALSGPEQAVAGFLAAAVLPPEADVLGPIELDTPGQDRHKATGGSGASNGANKDNEFSGDSGVDDALGPPVRALVRVPRSASMALAAALRAAQAVRSARKDPGPVRVQMDPAELI